MIKKILYILYQPYKWVVFFPFLVVSTLFFGFLTIILVPLTNPKIASYVCGAIWSRLNGYMTPIIVKVHGRENIDPKQSYVVVSNHQSHYDVFVLYGWLGIDFKWVMKQELRKVPGLGIGCEKVGHIFIDRSNSQKALQSLNEAKKKIINGTSVIFFPEGTRSKDGKVGDFKKGAFKMAFDLELPILPVTIVGTAKILPAHTINLFPGVVNVYIHKPIDINEFTESRIEELIQTTKSIITSSL
ncbi:MAG: 1-acyl-sn-glycerol-3-phosphate acyltransferase [Spirochaetes bacterium]|nr:1-acyl-sn-glycerol-3-phosphate acyltransferase [Spirochaetota bacterium]